VVPLGPLSVDHLERAILSRHAMSGYGVIFDGELDLGWQVGNLLLGARDVARRRRAAWFRTLHSASAGVLSDALRLWMASIRSVDDGSERIELGPVPRPPLTRLGLLPEEDLVTLLETTRQGWIVPDQHARLFRQPLQRSEAHLAHLAQLGLLVEEGGVARIAPHLRGPLHQVLSRRGWT
jgi:hypothetical protein